jgi:hypothetical protein
MRTLLINNYITDKEGVTLFFNKKFAPNDGIETDQIYVSWDKIGLALWPNKYCQSEVAKRRELRNQATKGDNHANCSKHINRFFDRSNKG